MTDVSSHLTGDERSVLWQYLWAQQLLDAPLSSRPPIVGASTDRLREMLTAGGGACGRAVRNALSIEPAPRIPVNVVLRGDRHFPEPLCQLPDAPFGLFSYGDTELLDTRAKPAIAIVGSRRPRTTSLAVARSIARGLADGGATIVSGLAIGIDGASHRSAIDANGSTIAVLGSGIDNIHPLRHRALARSIVEQHGLVLSEYGRAAEAKPWRFAARNRIIAGLARYVVVVQAAHGSGSLLTAEFAQQMGVEIGVVPSAIDDVAFLGSTALLRDGAHAVLDARGVCRHLGLNPDVTTEPHHEYQQLLLAPQLPDDLARLCDVPLEDVMIRLLDLEIDGMVARLVDGRYANVDPLG